MVVYLCDLAARREHLSEMALPARRVGTAAIAAHRRPVEHALDTTAHTAGGFGLRHPHRLNDAQYGRRVDSRDGHITEHREGVLPERGDDLRGVLAVPPLGLVLLVEPLCRLAESHLPGLGGGARR